MSWTTYPIGRPQRICAATGRPLAAGEHTIATLVENPQTGLIERRDFSAEAWNATPGPVPSRRLLASWKVTVPASDEKPRAVSRRSRVATRPTPFLREPRYASFLR